MTKRERLHRQLDELFVNPRKNQIDIEVVAILLHHVVKNVRGRARKARKG